jgi:predicted nuclease with TOPRIM domain
VSGAKAIFDRFRRAVKEDAARLRAENNEGQQHGIHLHRRDSLLENLVALVPDALDALESRLDELLAAAGEEGIFVVKSCQINKIFFLQIFLFYFFIIF